MWDEAIVFIFMSLSIIIVFVGIYSIGRTEKQKKKHNFINKICDILFEISDDNTKDY